MPAGASLINDDPALPILNAIVHLWISCEGLGAAGEDDEVDNVHIILERLCEKYNLPLAEAEAFANSPYDSLP